jgi:hypothetical protein
VAFPVEHPGQEREVADDQLDAVDITLGLYGWAKANLGVAHQRVNHGAQLFYFIDDHTSPARPSALSAANGTRAAKQWQHDRDA